MLTYTDFRRLLLAAPECADLDVYLAEMGGSVPPEALPLLEMAYTAAHDVLTIRSIADAAGLSLRKLAMTYGLPLRTVQDWAAGVRTPPEWQLPLIAYAVMSDREAQNEQAG